MSLINFSSSISGSEWDGVESDEGDDYFDPFVDTGVVDEYEDGEEGEYWSCYKTKNSFLGSYCTPIFFLFSILIVEFDEGWTFSDLILILFSFIAFLLSLKSFPYKSPFYNFSSNNLFYLLFLAIIISFLIT